MPFLRSACQYVAVLIAITGLPSQNAAMNVKNLNALYDTVEQIDITNPG